MSLKALFLPAAALGGAIYYGFRKEKTNPENPKSSNWEGRENPDDPPQEQDDASE